MPIFVQHLTVPPHTDASRPVAVEFRPGVGRVGRVWVRFPDGCLGAVGVRFLQEARQFAPMPSGWLHGNNETIQWEEGLELQGPPFRVVVEGYSRAVDWPHTVEVIIEVTLGR